MENLSSLVTITKSHPNPYFDNQPDAEETIDVEHPVAYVGVYEIHQLYGGPEEGGWFYYHYEHKTSIPLVSPGDESEIRDVIEFLKPRFISYGSIESCSGRAQQFDFVHEVEPGEHETKGRPHYE